MQPWEELVMGSEDTDLAKKCRLYEKKGLSSNRSVYQSEMLEQNQWVKNLGKENYACWTEQVLTIPVTDHLTTEEAVGISVPLKTMQIFNESTKGGYLP